jgi:hypothetical protein
MRHWEYSLLCMHQNLTLGLHDPATRKMGTKYKYDIRNKDYSILFFSYVIPLASLWLQALGVLRHWASALKKKFRTHVIKLDIAPKLYLPGQHLLVSASNNMLYYLSQ